MHPLSKDLTKFSDEELNKKINALYDRMRYFEAIGNPGPLMQARNLYLDYQEEFERRAQAAIEELYKDGSDYSDKIDIN